MWATAALKNLLAEANWFGLPGGTLLDRDGDNDSALFLVVTGSLGVFVADAQGQRRMVAHGAGRRNGGRNVADRRASMNIRPSWWRCATPSFCASAPKASRL